MTFREPKESHIKVRFASLKDNRALTLSYKVKSLKLRVKLNVSKEIIVIINTNIEINVISKDLAALANLLVNPEARMSIIAVTGDKRALISVYKNVEVSVSRTLVLIYLFVVSGIKSQLILGIL